MSEVSGTRAGKNPCVHEGDMMNHISFFVEVNLLKFYLILITTKDLLMFRRKVRALILHISRVQDNT